MDAKAKIGIAIRRHRESKGLSQHELAKASGITYQYLSSVENGKENFTLNVLESLATSIGLTVPMLVLEGYYGSGSSNPAPLVPPKNFRPGVPLPNGITLEQLATAMSETHNLIHLLNSSLLASGGKPLTKIIQSNNYSGIVSNLLSGAIAKHSDFHLNQETKYPDLIGPHEKSGKAIGLEIKSTIKIGKGGESHNGHSGWHLVACFEKDDATGDIRFIHVMVAELIGHTESVSDWKYMGSKVNRDTGSQRTETYTTNERGLAKLRDGSVFLDAERIVIKRWRQLKRESIPSHSIFYSAKPRTPIA